MLSALNASVLLRDLVPHLHLLSAALGILPFDDVPLTVAIAPEDTFTRPEADAIADDFFVVDPELARKVL